MNSNLLPLTNVHIILVRPNLSSNVGACCRSMYTFGLSSLRIVSSRKVAHTTTLTASRVATIHSQFILKNSLRYSTLEEATKDLNFVVGTTRRLRRTEFTEITVDSIRDEFLSLDDRYQIGFMFGSENQYVCLTSSADFRGDSQIKI
eukprot:TRINITY_DN102_c0_g1_i22.p1 TRINITY_DN102_c0_g1~~TRINITY_DN102_c0_g1_i22.p1  ORF type:complete len:170 (+),score=27.81 TRINITY_DN102_c0_g1_i22:71-511(+)